MSTSAFNMPCTSMCWMATQLDVDNERNATQSRQTQCAHNWGSMAHHVPTNYFFLQLQINSSQRAS